MNRRFLFVCAALLVLTHVALGDGIYLRTKDGKTFVWNDDPKPGDEAKWSGARDRDGYAHGFGTLIWYTNETGSAKPVLYARYWGNMVRGKLDGQVNVHSKRKTNHAVFNDGVRMTPWATGPASSRAGARWRAAIREPEPPAEGPVWAEAKMTQTPSPQSASIESSSEDLALNSQPPEPSTTESPAPTETDIDVALRLLVWPPPFLGMRFMSKGPRPSAKASLTRGEVIDLADATARSRGYDPAEYQLPRPQYDPSDQAWSLLYEEKAADGTGETGKHLSVAVGDKTKRTALVPGKE